MGTAAMQVFENAFRALTGTPGCFPWQRELFRRVVAGDIPASCNLPTGLGKTSVIPIWLVALALAPKNVPRRLVYVVNRRTVVDQATREAEKVRDNLSQVPEVESALRDLCEADSALAISTLRGQFADNREWSADPSRPAVIVGTVDMIGSRLLFSGYRVGFKGAPLHAGFLGQDALLVHDEAHLEPAFQKLIEDIEREQERERQRGAKVPWRSLRVMALSATARTGTEDGPTEKPFELTPDEKDAREELPDPPTDPIHYVWRRLRAQKQLHLKQAEDDARIAYEIAGLALERRKAENGQDADAAVLVFVRTLEDVKQVYDKLADKKTGVGPEHVQPLTGTMRGLERDCMADPRRPDASRVFARFLKPPKADSPQHERWQIEPMPGTVYLVCTSAGEVGIDISADHMVSDLSTFESMAQRLGRVNRYGEPTEHVARIDVVHPASFGRVDKTTGELKAHEIDKRRHNTLAVLKQLPSSGDKLYDASPKALGDLRGRTDLPCRIDDAFSPRPTMLDATDILFDAWALTSVREKMAGRPPVAPYLHGIAEWQPPESHVAWREEVEIITREFRDRHPPADLLDDYPLKPHEMLRDRSDRVFKHVEALAKRHPQKPVWLLDDSGAVDVTTLEKLADKQRKNLIDDCTILLPPSVGGLAGGMLDGASDHADDVADIPSARLRVWSDDPEYDSKTVGMRLVRSIEISASEDDEDEPRRWDWYESLPVEGGRTAKRPVTWDTHVNDVVCHASRMIAGLSLPPEIANAVILAAKLHDHGKRREQFQVTLGNRHYPRVLLAKSGRQGARLPEPFRHEFASVLDAQTDATFNELSEEIKDLVLHVIAAHHGRARPHFDLDEAFDPDRPQSEAEALAIETARRFARLQRKYGRWGLAYLESLLRAADWAASATPSAYADEPMQNP